MRDRILRLMWIPFVLVVAWLLYRHLLMSPNKIEEVTPLKEKRAIEETIETSEDFSF